MSYIGNTTQNQNYVPAIDYFNGDGSTVAFTLSRPVASVAAVQAVISNVPQNPGSAFTVSGSTITFTSAPPSGTANIYVYYTSPNTQVVQPGQGTVGTTQLADAAVTTAKLSSTTGTGAVALASLPSFTTTIGVGGATASASGSGITFPATQSASSDANTLDDYEEGTWTPTMLTSGGGSIAVTVLNATYTKVGRMVLAQFDIYTAASSFSGSAGNVQIGGFPFPTQGGGNARYASMVAYQDAFNVPNGVIVVALSGNGINSKADLAKSASQSATTTFSTSVVSGDFVGAANKYVQASLCYETST